MTPEELAVLADAVRQAFYRRFESGRVTDAVERGSIDRLALAAYEHLLGLERDRIGTKLLGERMGENLRDTNRELVASNREIFGKSPEEIEIERLQLEHLRADLERHGIKPDPSADVAELKRLFDAQAARTTPGGMPFRCTKCGSSLSNQPELELCPKCGVKL